MSFQRLKIGDRVNRMVGEENPTIMMEMEVVAIDEKKDLIECGSVMPDGRVLKMGWTFDRSCGCEEDEELGWGRKFGVTGTFLQLKEPQ